MKSLFKLSIACLSLATAVFTADGQVGMEVSISARIAPPPLPVYVQPACPMDGFLWTPGYWAYADDGYYWVPGVWVRPPHIGYLWTPPYWGFAGGVYGWHAGYWGTHVGFYGGVNYGYGYGGSGFVGGMWQGGGFRYNTAVMNVNTSVVHNTYVNRTVINTTVINNRTSFNGGPGGLAARPNAQEQMAMREQHVQATSEQVNHQQVMGRDRNQFASVNHGRPATVAMNRVNGNRYNPQGHAAAVSNNRANANGHIANRAAGNNRNATNNNQHAQIQHGQGQHPRPQGHPQHANRPAEHERR